MTQEDCNVFLQTLKVSRWPAPAQRRANEYGLLLPDPQRRLGVILGLVRGDWEGYGFASVSHPNYHKPYEEKAVVWNELDELLLGYFRWGRFEQAFWESRFRESPASLKELYYAKIIEI